jgi:hypothetical protein
MENIIMVSPVNTNKAAPVAQAPAETGFTLAQAAPTSGEGQFEMGVVQGDVPAYFTVPLAQQTINGSNPLAQVTVDIPRDFEGNEFSPSNVAEFLKKNNFLAPNGTIEFIGRDPTTPLNDRSYGELPEWQDPRANTPYDQLQNAANSSGFNILIGGETFVPANGG